MSEITPIHCQPEILESNRGPFGSQGGTQSTEPHQPGHNRHFFKVYCLDHLQDHLFWLWPFCSWDRLQFCFPEFCHNLTMTPLFGAKSFKSYSRGKTIWKQRVSSIEHNFPVPCQARSSEVTPMDLYLRGVVCKTPGEDNLYACKCKKEAYTLEQSVQLSA